ncbi:MAG: aminotransferase class V-fold PLP-dependent enzyme [Desulfurococcales archaeon]|jgi:aspartate aminotransferase-like enzyme|nr:aminotransferase class V-fold PLP-dependent enzyme [Desulfurococcales archaeon]
MARLFTPGPVEPYREALEGLLKPVLSHRFPGFRDLILDVASKLSKISGHRGGVAIFAGSGTLATEAMIYSLVSPGEGALVISYGVFGDRLAESAARRGAKVYLYRLDPGSQLDLGYVEDLVRRNKISWIATTHVETSYGHRLAELRELSKLAYTLGTPLLLDAVSSFAGEELDISAWGIGAVASCSQKALGSLPGISFVLVSDYLIERAKKVSTMAPPPRYMDLSIYIEHIEKGSTPYTPAINLLYSLEGALDRILRIGVERNIEIHRERAETIYRSIDTSLLAPLISIQNYRANTVAVFKIMDDRIRATQLADKLANEGIIIASGIGQDKERLIRIGTMGNISREDLEGLAERIKKILTSSPP